MRLIYCSTDKAVEQREQIMELEATDRERTEKRLDIKRKLKDIHASVGNLIKELQTFNWTVKEGNEMMRGMVDRFEKVKAKNDALKKLIKQKDGDIIGLVARLMGEYEKATLKDRYELLKEYKQDFL